MSFGHNVIGQDGYADIPESTGIDTKMSVAARREHDDNNESSKRMKYGRKYLRPLLIQCIKYDCASMYLKCYYIKKIIM